MEMGKKIGFIFGICILFLSIISISTLYTIYQSTSELSQEKQTLQNELNSCEKELTNVDLQIYYTENELIKTRNSLNETCYEVEMRQSDGIYELHNPSYSEAMNFIKTDKTNYKKYDDETFNCAHYSLEVNNESESRGIRCAFVVVNLSGGVAHALVAFNTTDKGILYIEPQSDEKVNLEVGKDYWADCVVEKSSRYYYEKDPDNIVKDYELYW
jgi:hypothetical protein